MARKPKRLDNVVGVTVVEPELSDQGWRFAGTDALSGASYMHDLYTRADDRFTGRATVPVLWDKATGTIVSNESADIVRMFIDGFGDLADATIDLYPEALRAEINAWNARIYPALNNGVYRAGFATTQVADEDAFHDVFAMLDKLETHLASCDYLVGNCLTEADIRLFVTLVRFDVAYHGLFKCNLKRIVDYPALSAYMARVLDIPGIRETVSIAHIKRGYYSIKALNPTGIVPLGPRTAPERPQCAPQLSAVTISPGTPASRSRHQILASRLSHIPILLLLTLVAFGLTACSSLDAAPGLEEIAARQVAPHYGTLSDEKFPVPAFNVSRIKARNLRQIVDFKTDEHPGTIVIDTDNRFLYLVQEHSTAIRYGIGVGVDGLQFTGSAVVGFKRPWPRWTPTADMIRRNPDLYDKWKGGMEGGQPIRSARALCTSSRMARTRCSAFTARRSRIPSARLCHRAAFACSTTMSSISIDACRPKRE